MTTFAGKDDILTLLIHLGYLGYDNENKEVFIPNKEILDVFKTSTDDKDGFIYLITSYIPDSSRWESYYTTRIKENNNKELI